MSSGKALEARIVSADEKKIIFRAENVEVTIFCPFRILRILQCCSGHNKENMQHYTKKTSVHNRAKRSKVCQRSELLTLLQTGVHCVLL